MRPLIDLVDPARPITYGILKPGPHQEDGVLYVRVVDMKVDGLASTGVRRTSREISKQYARSLLREGDILLSIRGQVGRVAPVPAELDGANITQDTARLAILHADPRFVAECLRVSSVQDWMVARTRGAAVRGINLRDVKQLPIITPPRPQQQQFASRAEVMDRLASAFVASWQLAEELYSSLQFEVYVRAAQTSLVKTDTVTAVA